MAGQKECLFMNEKKIRVAVLFGGVSSEHEISLMSVQSVLRNMPEDYEVLTIGITKDGRWVEYTGSIDEITDQNGSRIKICAPLLFPRTAATRAFCSSIKIRLPLFRSISVSRFCTENMVRMAPFRACSSWQESRLSAAT